MSAPPPPLPYPSPKYKVFFCIGATIGTSKEIHCLLYAGFLGIILVLQNPNTGIMRDQRCLFWICKNLHIIVLY